jgi:hypothetical protein
VYYEPSEIVDRASRPMVAGNPLRIFKRQRTGADRYQQLGMQQVAGCIGEVHMQHDRGAHVLRPLLAIAAPCQKSKQTAAENTASNAGHHV